MSWQIRSGAFDLDAPEIKLKDITHNLSHICRFAGGCDPFWSVADHTLLCKWIGDVWNIEEKLRLPLLLHDAPEAYIHDIVAPIKSNLGPWYAEQTSRLAAAIAKRFGFDPVIFTHPKIHRIDQAALYVESHFLFENRIQELWSWLDQEFSNEQSLAPIVESLRNSVQAQNDFATTRSRLHEAIITEFVT